MAPTAAGRQLVEPARQMQQAMLRMSLGAAAHDPSLAGVVRISASVSLATFVLPGLLAMLRGLQPGIRFEVIATDSHSNLLQREADLAIRLAQPRHAELIAKRVAQFPLGLYASAAYLSRHGVPSADPARLLHHHFIDVAPQHPLRNGMVALGMPQVADRVVCVCSDHASAWQMARAGIGIASSLVVAAAQDRSMTPVLTDIQPGGFPVWLVTHRGLRMQPRLRLVSDYLAQALRTLAGAA
jgi:DNA-binding transcriptional LysR family regulator